jgi:Integrase core domain
VFKDLMTAQEAMDEWVEHYNSQRPHRSLDDVTPASRFKAGDTQVREPERNGDYWVSRKVTSNGIVCVGYQKVNVGQRNAGSACDILVRDGLLQFWVAANWSRRKPERPKELSARRMPRGRPRGASVAEEC